MKVTEGELDVLVLSLYDKVEADAAAVYNSSMALMCFALGELFGSNAKDLAGATMRRLTDKLTATVAKEGQQKSFDKGNFLEDTL